MIDDALQKIFGYFPHSMVYVQACKLNLLSSRERDAFSVSLAAEIALSFSSRDSSETGTSVFSTSILSQLR